MTEMITGKTMTVKEVAQILNLDIRTVQLKAKELFPDIIENGKTTYLNEIQTTAIKLDLEKKFEVKTDLEVELLVQQALLLQAEKIKRLSVKIKEMTPKAESFDKFLSATNSQPVGDVGKMLNIGRTTFFKMLKKDGILDSNRIPYQSHMKYFEVIDKPVKIGKEIKNIPVTMVKPEGIDYLSKKYGERC